MPERVGDQATMEPPKFERCSILLTFQKLMIWDAIGPIATNSPGASGTQRRGHLGKRRGGGPATFRLRADHTQLGRAVLFCSLSQLAKPVLRSVSPHVNALFTTMVSCAAFFGLDGCCFLS